MNSLQYSLCGPVEGSIAFLLRDEVVGCKASYYPNSCLATLVQAC